MGLLRTAAAVLLAGAGAVHAGFAPAHMEHPIHAAFFVGVAAFQFGAAALLLRGPSRRAVDLVIDGNAAIILLWAISRLAGPVLAPGASWHEPVGFADALCTALELGGIGLLALASSRACRPRPWPSRSLSTPMAVTFLASLGIAVAVFAGQALSTAGSHHGDAEPCTSSACIYNGFTSSGHGH